MNIQGTLILGIIIILILGINISSVKMHPVNLLSYCVVWAVKDCNSRQALLFSPEILGLMLSC